MNSKGGIVKAFSQFCSDFNEYLKSEHNIDKYDSISKSNIITADSLTNKETRYLNSKLIKNEITKTK